MLRLWPDYELGLFPRTSWLRSTRQEQTADCNYDGIDRSGLNQAASFLLSLPTRRRMGRRSIDVTLSDEAAPSVLLPWQDRLRTSAQMTRYAEACLTDTGLTLDRDWIVKASFRRFGSSGLALAVRRDFLLGLAALARARNDALRSVLPLSAKGYWAYRGVWSQQEERCLLLHEPTRLTLLGYGGNSLKSIDVEPLLPTEVESSVARLLRRHSARCSPAIIDYWSACPAKLEGDIFARLVPDIPVRTLPRSF